MDEELMKDLFEDLQEVKHKIEKVSQKFQKMGMRGGYRRMGYREGQSRERGMDDYQHDSNWFDPRYM